MVLDAILGICLIVFGVGVALLISWLSLSAEDVQQIVKLVTPTNWNSR